MIPGDMTSAKGKGEGDEGKATGDEVKVNVREVARLPCPYF
jgi:hypothetical protein